MNVSLRILALSTAPAVALAGTEVLPVCAPMPALLHAEQPRYPDRESRVAVEGAVTLQFTIRADGSVADPIVVENDPADTADWFNAPALEAIRLFRFAAVKTPCQGQTKIVFKVVSTSGTPNTSFERTREG
jgi:TonB family protein